MLFSDVHLGFPTSLPLLLLKALVQLSRKYTITRIIIVGDYADDYFFRNFCSPKSRRQQNKLSRWLRLFAKNGGELVLTDGNHDRFAAKHLKGVGCRRKQHYLWKQGNTQCLAIHGDGYDEYMKVGWKYLVAEFFSMIYLLCQLMCKHYNPGKGPRLVHQRWLAAADKVLTRVCAAAKSHQANIVFFGHTHIAGVFHRDGVTAINCGCWTLAPGHLALLSDEEVQLIAMHPETGMTTVEQHQL